MADENFQSDEYPTGDGVTEAPADTLCTFCNHPINVVQTKDQSGNPYCSISCWNANGTP